MPDTHPQQTELPDSSDNEKTEPALLRIAEKPEEPAQPVTSRPSAEASPTTPPSPRIMERPGTIEHLAARRLPPEIDANTPEIKQRLARLRTEITRLLTSLRWEGASVEETAKQFIPLLNVGSVQQWKPILLPFLHEIDRAGNLIPVWLYIIDQGDPKDLSPQTNPADTVEGRARRFAVLMLGYHKTITTEQPKAIGFTRQIANQSHAKSADLTRVLGKLVLDPNLSMYATQALVQHETTSAMQALISALKEAEGWAKVDIVESCLELKQEGFYDILLTGALERVSGLESYVAIPLYRKIPLERYLRGEGKVSSVQTQQAALIVHHVLQDSINPPTGEEKPQPSILQRPFPELAQALFEGTRSNPMWQNTVAVHRLGALLGRYWAAISRGELRDPAILDPIYQTVPMMPEVERWMAGPGRDVLLTTVQAKIGEETLTPTVRVLGELREPRAISPLLGHLETTTTVTGHAQALTLGAMCDALGQLADRRAVPVLQQFLQRVVALDRRSNLPKRVDNLPTGDPEIPGSIVYASVLRALGLLGDKNALNNALRAVNDFDPYVRVQALEAVKRLDASGEDPRSRQAAREALNDPRENNIRVAAQLVQQYRDNEARSTLQQLIETRPTLSGLAYETLRHLG
jgi:hypothetical protein